MKGSSYNIKIYTSFLGCEFIFRCEINLLEEQFCACWGRPGQLEYHDSMSVMVQEALGGLLSI